MIVEEKKNKTMQWKKKNGTTQEEIRKQHLQSKFPTSAVIPFLPKSGHLGSKLLVIALNAMVCTVWYERQWEQSIFQSISSPDGTLRYRLRI